MVRHRRRLQPVSTHVLPPTRPGLAAHLPPSPRAHCKVHARGSHRFFGHRAHLCLRRRCTTAERRLTGRPSMLCCSCAHALAHNKLLGKQGGGLELILACDSHCSKASSQRRSLPCCRLPVGRRTPNRKGLGAPAVAVIRVTPRRETATLPLYIQESNAGAVLRFVVHFALSVESRRESRCESRNRYPTFAPDVASQKIRSNTESEL